MHVGVALHDLWDQARERVSLDTECGTAVLILETDDGILMSNLVEGTEDAGGVTQNLLMTVVTMMNGGGNDGS